MSKYATYRIVKAIEEIDALGEELKHFKWFDEENKEAAMTDLEAAVVYLDSVEDIVERDEAYRSADEQITETFNEE